MSEKKGIRVEPNITKEYRMDDDSNDDIQKALQV